VSERYATKLQKKLKKKLLEKLTRAHGAPAEFEPATPDFESDLRV
jgi:hypothetical protein